MTPIVIATNGLGIAVVQTTAKKGAPMTIAANGRGIPVVIASNGLGIPVFIDNLP